MHQMTGQPDRGYMPDLTYICQSANVAARYSEYTLDLTALAGQQIHGGSNLHQLDSQHVKLTGDTRQI